MPELEGKVVITVDKVSNESMIDPGSRAKYILWTVVLAALVLCFASISATSLSHTAYAVTMGRSELPVQVYTPAQATRAAKAAVAQLQLIEQRRPHAASAANPLALPKTKETDLSSER